MSKLLTEISRIHELMDISRNGYDPLKKMLLNEDTGYGDIMKIYEKIFSKTAQQLDETEQTYLKNFIDEYNKKFPSGKITYTGSLDNLTREALQKTIRNESDNIIKELFSGAIRKIQRPDLILGSSNLIKSDTIIQNYLKNRKVDVGGMTNSTSEPTTSLDLLVFINKNGGEIEKTNIPLDSYDIVKSEFEVMINHLGNDNPISKNMSDIVNQIDEYNGVKTVIEDPEIEKVINNIKGSNSVTNNLTNFKGTDKTILDLFKKEGIFYKEGIELIRTLTDKFLKDYQKLYTEGASQNEIQNYLSALNLLKQRFGNSKIYSQSIQDGTKTQKLTLDDFINQVENNFKRIYDENGNWSPLNKLDTNWNDMPIELTKFIKTILTPEEYNNFIKKTQDYINAVDNVEKVKLKSELDKEFDNIKVKLNQNNDYVKNWTKRVDEITKNIKKNTDSGNLSEQKVNELFEKEGLKVEFTASEGSPIDVLLSIDQIVNDTKGIFGGGQKTVQTKTAGKITEGEFQVVNGKRSWVEKSGTNSYRVEVFPGQRISKQSQIDLAGFYDKNSNITIITGKQKGLAKVFDEETGKMKIMYNADKTPMYSNSQELPGATLIKPKNSTSPYVAFIIDAETTKIVSK
jgi:hypothetical protein